MKPIKINFETMGLYERRDRNRQEGVSPMLESYKLIKSNPELRKAVYKRIREQYIIQDDL